MHLSEEQKSEGTKILTFLFENLLLKKIWFFKLFLISNNPKDHWTLQWKGFNLYFQWKGGFGSSKWRQFWRSFRIRSKSWFFKNLKAHGWKIYFFLGQKAYSQVQEMLVSGIYTKNVISSWRLLLTWSFTKKIHWKLLALRGCWDPYKAIFIPITHDSPPKVSAMDQSMRCPTSPPAT